MSKMKTIRVEFDSEAVKSATYNKESRTLSISYSTGGRYAYSRVPFWMFEQMCRTRSVGRYVNKNIKGAFSSTKKR
jgi:hypothetical protein